MTNQNPLKKETIRWVILVVVALVALGIVGYYWYGVMKELTELSKLPEIVTLPKEKPIDTSDWKTYRNEEFGYEIQYPEDKVEIVLDDVFERGSVGNPSFRIRSGGHFAMGVWDNPKNYTAKEWIEEQYAPIGGWAGVFKEITIGKEKAYSATGAPMCYVEWIIIPKLNKMYTFGVEICNIDKDFSLKTFKDIVSTFKFLE